LLARWGVDAIVSVLPTSLPRYNTRGIDGHVLVFSLAVSLLTITIYGI
jgi:hypothetical protein